MQEIEQTKAKKITIPRRVKRYGVAYFRSSIGWENWGNFFTTPESALENFLRFNNTDKNDEWSIKFYQIYELDLEIPILK